MTDFIILWYKIRAVLWMYMVGTYYTFKQLFWKVDKNFKKFKKFKFSNSSTSINTKNAETPVALITGGTKGIGFELAKLLVREKFSLILAARDGNDGRKAVDYLTKLASSSENGNVSDESAAEDPNGKIASQKTAANSSSVGVDFYSVDLSDLDQLAEFVNYVKNKHKKLHLLVNNAALMMTPYRPVKNKPYEVQWAVNVVGTVYLTEKLMDLVRKAASDDGLGRVINLSSSSQFSHFLTSDYFRTPTTSERYSSHEAYSNSKIAVALYTRDLQTRLDSGSGSPDGVITCCLHPGVISTGLYQHLSPPNRLFFSNPLVRSFLRSQKDAAWDMLYLCLADSENLTPGAYYENNEPTPMSTVDWETQKAFETYVQELIKSF